VLNVAKEVASPLDSVVAQPLRAVASTPNFKKPRNSDSTYYPPNLATGRPGMHYLKLQWSHGQQDLVDVGFQAGMSFTDAALERGEGVLIQYVDIS
jgi:tyrosine-protein phosphatase